MFPNIPSRIYSLMNKGYHRHVDHPLCLAKQRVESCLGSKFPAYENLDPIVSVKDNFDSLLVQKKHPSRRDTDVYYCDEDRVLRTHTTAHLSQMLAMKQGTAARDDKKFLVVGEVYRKDYVDRWHQPIFHQMEGVCLDGSDMLEVLDSAVYRFFPDLAYRRVVSHYPFTSQSYEYEIKKNGKWIEIMGCGIIDQQIIDNCDRKGETAWAFGLGLERMAMLLYNIPDIRWFWADDESFLSQFRKKTPKCNLGRQPAFLREISLKVYPGFCHTEFCSQVWEAAGHLIERVKLAKQYSSLSGRHRDYRLFYSAVNRSLTTSEVNDIHGRVMEAVAKMDVKVKDVP